MAHQRNNSKYQDPYQEPGAEYLANDKGSSTQASYSDLQYGDGQYGNYNNAMAADKYDDDGVHALGEIAPGERQTAGRAGLQNPTSSFAAMGPPPRSTGVLREWRKEERGRQWGKGGPCMAFLRFAVCCLPTTILLVISIILAILVYVRPPFVTPGFDFGGDNVVKEGASLLQKQNASISLQGFYLPFLIPFYVGNPNWFTAEFSKIEADVQYTPTSTQFGQGQLEGTKLAAYNTSLLNFPFNVNWSTSSNTSGGNNEKFITSLLSDCGYDVASGQSITPKDWNMKLALHLTIKVLSIKIGIPTINVNSIGIPCPFTGDDVNTLKAILKTIVNSKRSEIEGGDSAAEL